jgi:dihydrolipoamide dehydrogenase
MKSIETDVLVLGAGTAGLTARRSVERAGKSALIADGGPLGTTCARVGCMPSKLLIAAARAADDAHRAALFGVRTTVEVDGSAVMERVRRERDRFVASVLEPLGPLEEAGVLLRGAGRFLEPGVVRIGDHTIVRAAAIVLATGTRPYVPPPYAALGDLVVTSDTVFDLTEIPKRLFVVGTGPIGLELGQAMSSLACEVTIVGTDGRIGPFHDPKMQAEARAVFGATLDIHPQITLESAVREGGVAKFVFVDPDGTRHTREADRVLVAAGRRAHWHELDLQHAGIPLDEGVPMVDPLTCQCGDAPVFVAGDANGFRPILHEAADDGHVAGANAARYPDVIAKARRTEMKIAFSDPQQAVVGMPWDRLDCDRHRVGEIDWRTQGRSQVDARALGRTRIYAEVDTARIVGAEMLGPAVEHLAHLLAWAIQAGVTVPQALAMPFYHPVVEEGLRTALVDLQAQLRLARPRGEPCEEFGPGG